MKKQWKLDNKGMTLLEVIVAFAIFAIAATILITGFNGALKVMGNSAIIKDTSQANASGIETGSPLDSIENAQVNTLDKPKFLNFKINGQENTFKINGSYQIASAPKRNDGLIMSMVAFKVDSLDTPSVPQPPEDVGSIIPKIPDLKNMDAYWNPYKDKNGEIHTYLNQDGSFNHNNFEFDYKDLFGINLYRGVITNTVYVSNLEAIPANERLRQLFFINEKPLIFEGYSGQALYVVDFLYLGSNVDDLQPNIIKMNNQSSLLLRSYQYRAEEGEYQPNNNTIYKDHLVLLYLPKDLEIQCFPPNSDYDSTEFYLKIIIPAGYYQIPSGTDILSTVKGELRWDDSELKKYTEPASINRDSYQMTDDEVKAALANLKQIGTPVITE